MYAPSITGSAHTNAEMSIEGEDMMPEIPGISLSVLRNSRHTPMHGITGHIKMTNLFMLFLSPKYL